LSEQVLIQLLDVSRTYQIGERHFRALESLALEIERGQFVAVTGPSGSGKSTLLNLVAGIDRPTSGQVWVDGVRVDTMDENALARWRGRMVGIVFQFFQLLPTLTVIENVALPIQLRSLWKRPDQGRAHEVLARVGMSDHVTKIPSELSGGEKQRVALARALVNEPPILIADEPTGNLDSATGAAIIDLLIEQHRAGKTIILVTHEQRLAEVAQRRICLLDGRLDGDVVRRRVSRTVDGV